MMKSVLFLASFAAACVAQSVSIGSPLPGTTIFPGEQLTVKVDKPDSLTGSTDVYLKISLAEIGCENPTCVENPGNATILYHGPYDPVPDSSDSSKPPFQDFEVTIPTRFQQGDVSLLIVKHWVAVGAGQISSLDIHNVTLKVEAPPQKRAIGGRILV